MSPCCDKGAIGIELLDAVIVRICYIDIAGIINRDTLRV